MKRILGSLAVLIATFALLTGAEQLIDRIAAVVNDDIILRSEVDEKMFILDAQNQLAGKDSTQIAQIRSDVLNRLIEERLVVQRAKSQGITVDDSEVTQQVDQAMAKVKSQFPTEEDFQDALKKEGITLTMLRERYESDIRQELLAQKVVGREIRSKVEVTSDQVQKYYDEHKDDLPQKPDEVHLAHIVIYPVDPAKDQAALDKIQAARKRIVGGESFETVAREVSDDPSSGNGGLLPGWYQPGDLDPDFEAAAESLQVGELSEPVRTQYGYHLIEVVDRDGQKYQVRHILARVQASEADLQKADSLAEKAREKVMSGEDFGKVAAEMSDDPLTKDKDGDLGWTPIQALVPAVAQIIDSVGVNGISPVVRSNRGFHVFKVLNRRSGGAYTYDEIQGQLKNYLENQELEKAYDKWMSSVRDSAYVEIKSAS
jgi:peptidyl-prolyl cis-trans isomerase SurA